MATTIAEKIGQIDGVTVYHGKHFVMFECSHVGPFVLARQILMRTACSYQEDEADYPDADTAYILISPAKEVDKMILNRQDTVVIGDQTYIVVTGGYDGSRIELIKLLRAHNLIDGVTSGLVITEMLPIYAVQTTDEPGVYHNGVLLQIPE